MLQGVFSYCMFLLKSIPFVFKKIPSKNTSIFSSRELSNILQYEGHFCYSVYLLILTRNFSLFKFSSYYKLLLCFYLFRMRGLIFSLTDANDLHRFFMFQNESLSSSPDGGTPIHSEFETIMLIGHYYSLRYYIYIFLF